MKKFAIILLTTIYFFGATGASQLFKLPVLVKHFVTHRQENPSLSLLQFLKIHYADPFVMDEDYQTDMKLPFKTLDNANFLALTNMLGARMMIEHKATLLLPSDFLDRNIDVDNQLSSCDFFQPPRMIA